MVLILYQKCAIVLVSQSSKKPEGGNAMTKHLSFTLVILVMAVLEATRPAYADEDYFVPLQLHYVNGDRNGESINVQDLIGNVWQLREIITTFDDRDGYPPIAEVRVV